MERAGGAESVSEQRHERDTRASAGYTAPIDLGPRRGGRGARVAARVRRVFLWLSMLAASSVAVGVLLQAFSIAAYVRGAGHGALELHQTGGFVTHSVEVVVFLTALVGSWGAWRRVGLALLLAVLGTVQVILIGDTSSSGSWINGLHGLFALVVFLLAVVLARDGMRSLRTAPSETARTGFEPLVPETPRGATP